MRTARKVLIPVFAVVLILSGALVLSWADADVELPGITVEDTHPNGCVDCHRDAGENDYRLNAGLKQVSGHPDITRIVNTVPTDCGMCHKASVPAGALSQRVHKAHFSNPEENHFVAYYRGECLACHALNVDTGVMSIKTGPKNW